MAADITRSSFNVQFTSCVRVCVWGGGGGGKSITFYFKQNLSFQFLSVKMLKLSKVYLTTKETGLILCVIFCSK